MLQVTSWKGCYSGYYINNFCFYTKVEDDKSRDQNNGVTIETKTMHFVNSRDKNLIIAFMSYIGMIEDI